MNHSSFTGNTHLDEQQRAAAADCSGSSLLLAVPGSGKTTTLLARLENLLRSGVPDTSVLVITFTNNAAEEMKQRFRRQYGSNRVDFMTINSFCYRVVCFYADKTGRQKPEDLTDTGLLLRRILVSVAGGFFSRGERYSGVCAEDYLHQEHAAFGGGDGEASNRGLPGEAPV